MVVTISTSQKEINLILKAKNKDEESLEILVNKYYSYVRNRVQSYYVKGHTIEDLIQIGLMGLLEAIDKYDKDKNSSFKHFAGKCIHRKVLMEVRTSTRKKRVPENIDGDASLDKPLMEDGLSLYDLTPGKYQDPLDVVIEKENIREISSYIFSKLSKLEREVLSLFILDYSYKSISNILNKNEKSIDNTIMRSKKKMKKYLAI